jgi:sugar O-acyltransferase (sialic acid O-acetyltransferase NeuD family)
MGNNVLLIGSGVETISTIKNAGYNIVGIVDPSLESNIWNSIAVFKNETEAKKKTSIKKAIVSIDNIDNRKRAFEKLKLLSIDIIAIKGGYTGNNTVIGSGAFLQRFSHLSDNCKVGIGSRLNINANVMHDTVIGDFVTIAPNAVILGRVRIGNYSYIGANATVLPGINIGSRVIVGAGSVVTRNVKDAKIVKGNPAK